MKISKSGFTIVELLIVIVVIAILAAISIVAYNGVQQRARDSKRTSDIGAIVKGASLWGTDGGKTFADMNASGAGSAIGWFDARYSNSKSVKEVLVDSGYLANSVQDPINRQVGGSMASAYMIARCDDSDQTTRVILAKLEKSPSQPVAQQVGRTCTSSIYTDYVNNYQMNYGRLIQL